VYQIIENLFPIFLLNYTKFNFNSKHEVNKHGEHVPTYTILIRMEDNGSDRVVHVKAASNQPQQQKYRSYIEIALSRRSS
jgi:hypothetical protein